MVDHIYVNKALLYRRLPTKAVNMNECLILITDLMLDWINFAIKAVGIFWCLGEQLSLTSVGNVRLQLNKVH